MQINVLINKQKVLGRTNYLLSFDTTRTAQKTTEFEGHKDIEVNNDII
jgi:hypothetical protein